MPEMPEVQGLVEFLRGRVTGVDVARVTVANVAALKTYDPPIDALTGTTITGAARHGKFVDLSTTGPHLVFHLAKAGWLRWYDELPKTVIKPGRSPIALRVALGDGSGFDLTEAGTKKSLSVYVVRDPSEVPGVARLGPDPLDPENLLAEHGRGILLARLQFDEFEFLENGNHVRMKKLLTGRGGQ